VSTVSARAYEMVRSLIIQGRFRPGERLKEDELTVLCDVSRTPVREALRRLAVEGLVVILPNQGAHVSAMDPGEIDEIYALRAMIESHAARRAAVRLTPTDLERLAELAEQMEAVVAAGGGDVHERFPVLNGEFHRLILDAAASPRLSVMAGMVVEIPLVLRTLARYSDKELERSQHHHRELIAAFEARDVEWAGAVMRSHIQAASHAVTRGLSETSDTHDIPN
jgi:DNA-binding GntR family transcriptional regulator